MKTKKLTKKLTLNKSTLVNLDLKTMNEVQGGRTETCKTYCQATICSGVYCC